MTRTFSDGHPKVLPACSFLSQYYFYNFFLQKSCRFSLQTLTKFEAGKTGSGVGYLRLTAVCPGMPWNDPILSPKIADFRLNCACLPCNAIFLISTKARNKRGEFEDLLVLGV